MGLDQGPVNRVAKQGAEMYDLLSNKAFLWGIKGEVFPVADPGHQLDSQQVRQTKDRFRLPLRIRM